MPSISTEVAYHEVEAAEVKGEVDSCSALMVDVRLPEQYQRGHVRGAVLIPVRQLRERLKELPKDRRIIFVCEDGSKSMLACELCMAADFCADSLYNIIDGMPGCRKSGYSMERGSGGAAQQDGSESR